jgi:flagellum-specific ATP synthase
VKVHPWLKQIERFDPVRRTGRVQKIMPTRIEADGPAVPLGALCRVEAKTATGAVTILAEVIKVDRKSISLALLEDGGSPFSGATVEAVATAHHVPVGDGFLGRVVDALGRPLDDGDLVSASSTHSLLGAAPSPLERSSPRERFQTGIRAVDGLLTLGVGQRVGIFAAAGVGKTSLVTQLATQANADITVLALIGERGREVEALWSSLGKAKRKMTTIVSATSDQPATMRIRAAYYAMTLADHWRAQGRHVLLVVDSMTRLAMAMREIGLAAGEPPTVRAYTPNIFSAIPRFVERAGALRGGGAISAIMTVLSETDDVDDPVSEMMKSLLDGHVILSRSLAEEGHFPAIDVARSVSRQASDLYSAPQRRRARLVSGWINAFDQSRAMRQAGLYAVGSDPQIDDAVSRHPEIVRFLRQDMVEISTLTQTDDALLRITAGSA